MTAYYLVSNPAVYHHRFWLGQTIVGLLQHRNVNTDLHDIVFVRSVASPAVVYNRTVLEFWTHICLVIAPGLVDKCIR